MTESAAAAVLLLVVVFLFLAVAVAVAVAVAMVRGALARRRGPARNRNTSAQHDDSLRVGREPDADPATAARRAMGRNAWMRPGGGSS